MIILYNQVKITQEKFLKKLFITIMLLAGIQTLTANPTFNLLNDCKQEKPTDYLLGLTEGIRTTLMPKNIKTSLANYEIVSLACKKTVAKNHPYRFDLMLRAEIRNVLQNR